MNASRWIRQTHRWLAIAFVSTVVVNFVLIGIGHGKQPSAWITYSPLFPLAVLMFTGLYMFFLPDKAKRRDA